MKHIKQLSKISTYQPSSGPLLTLYDLALKGLSREEIFDHFRDRGSNYFNVILSRLKSKLLEGVLFYPFNDHAEHLTRSLAAYNEFSVCLRLLRTGNKIVGLSETEKVLTKTIDLGMTGCALMLAIELEIYYSTIGNYSKYKKYAALSDDLKKEFDREIAIQKIFNELAFSIKKKLPKEDILEKLTAFKKEMPGQFYRSNLFYFSAWNLWHRFHENKPAIIQTCQEATQFFNQFKTPIPFTTRWNFMRQMIPIYVAEKKYPEAAVMAKRCVKLCTEGNYNWHLSLIYLALVAFHNGKPKVAFQAYKTAHSVPMKFERVDDIQERWQLIRSYLSLYNLHVPGTFRLYKFLNSIPTLNADKSRNNVAVIISHLLHLWKAGEREQFGDLSKQLRRYIQRHLRKPGLERPRWFLMMLEKFYESNYHPVRYEPRVKALWKKIQNTPSEISVNVLETEVIPIEVAWGMVVGEK
ncbi:MAG: hypothetical protein AAFZ15_34235 [Bacteroidota bacterium]